jgi:uncharacterized glyoxalase superfamily protein PhnB/ketosteroid isomerase-like protein
MTDINTTRTDGPTRVWPVLAYRDAPAAMEFLTEAFGFEKRVAYARDDDPTVIEHAEMRWAGSGGLMLGTAGKDDSVFGQRSPGNDCVYIDCDDPDDLFDRAVASGAEVVRGLKEEDYGSRGFTVRDPEGNLWSFGTYDGEARPDHDEPQSTIDTFASLLADWAEALVANDAEAIGAFAEPDWVFVGENGIVPGSTFLDNVNSGLVTHSAMTFEVAKARIMGDTAVVVARCDNHGTWQGEPFHLDEWTSDVFILRGDRWRCSLTHLTSVRT